MMAEAIVESTSKDEENKSPWSRPQAACLIEDISTDSDFNLGSYEAIGYFKRLATYQFQKWSVKPLEFSPRQCASRGWICEGKDLLKCSDCRQFLVCSLPPLYDILLYNKCVEKIKDGLTSGHSTTCQWRSSPVSVSLTAPCVESKETAGQDFITRVNKLTALADVFTNFHNLHMETLANMKISDLDFTNLKTLVLSTATVPESSLYFTILSALAGWEPKTLSSDTPLLSCQFCLRNVGLWLFAKKTEQHNQVLHESNNTSEERNEESPPKKRKLQERNFNPTAQHERWCPWMELINPTYPLCNWPEETGDYVYPDAREALPRWQILLETLVHADKRAQNNSPSKEIYFVARSLLNECVQTAVDVCDGNEAD